MPACTDHEGFVIKSGDSRLWRFTDFPKFVSLISKGALHFCRSDRFNDPFEGSYGTYNSTQRPHVYSHMKTKDVDNMLTQFTRITTQLRQWTYVNCWHANVYESAAMWSLYSATDDSVAIETTFDKLTNVLPDRVVLGYVNYIDYDTEWLPEGNMLYPFTHKRKSFEHEKEVRAIIQELPPSDGSVDLGVYNGKLVEEVSVSLNDLITVIHVSPSASPWFVDMVRDVSKKYNISANVQQSSLYSNANLK